MPEQPAGWILASPACLWSLQTCPHSLCIAPLAPP